MSGGATERAPARVPLAGLSVVAACGVVLFRAGLSSWFMLDDFVWLRVARAARERGWWETLLSNTIHGTWRPLSEPAFFTVFWRLFGWNARPYRALVFATYALGVVLIGALAARLGATRRQSLAAALFFAVQAGLAVPMTWTCSYNQVLTTAFIAGELLLWRAYCDHGGRARYALLMSVYALSLLSLELNVVFPAIAAAFVLLLAPRARRRALLVRLAPLAALAIAWCVIHVLHAPPAADGPYRIRVGGATLVTSWRYWSWTVLPSGPWHDQAWRSIVPAIAAVAACAFVAARARRGDRRPLFFAATWLLLIGPSLLLPDHLTDYLVVAPALGFALLLAAALEALFTLGPAARAAAVALGLGYTSAMAWAARDATESWASHSLAIQPVVRALVELRAREPVRRPLWIEEPSGEFLRFAVHAGALDHLFLAPICVDARPEQIVGLTVAERSLCSDPEWRAEGHGQGDDRRVRESELAAGEVVP